MRGAKGKGYSGKAAPASNLTASSWPLIIGGKELHRKERDLSDLNKGRLNLSEEGIQEKMRRGTSFA